MMLKLNWLFPYEVYTLNPKVKVWSVGLRRVHLLAISTHLRIAQLPSQALICTRHNHSSDGGAYRLTLS